MSDDYYRGAGDGQCLAVKNDGERCTNGVYGSDLFCGIHKNASDVTPAPETDDRTWFKCPHCGWQPADYAGPGTAPMCSDCGVEFPVDAAEWDNHPNREYAIRADGGTVEDVHEEPTTRERRTSCPRCDHDGALDGMGPFTRETEYRRLGEDGIDRKFERWYKMRCPECDLVFATQDRVVRRGVEPDTGRSGGGGDAE